MKVTLTLAKMGDDMQGTLFERLDIEVITTTAELDRLHAAWVADLAKPEGLRFSAGGHDCGHFTAVHRDGDRINGDLLLYDTVMGRHMALTLQKLGAKVEL